MNILQLDNQRDCLNSCWSHYINLSHQHKRFAYKIGVKFNKTISVTEKSNYLSKIVSAYIFHGLDYWPANILNNFMLKIIFLVRLI